MGNPNVERWEVFLLFVLLQGDKQEQIFSADHIPFYSILSTTP